MIFSCGDLDDLPLVVDNFKIRITQVECGDIETDFPLKEFLSFLGQKPEDHPSDYTEVFVDQLPDFSDAGLLNNNRSDKKARDGVAESKGLDIGLPGVRFYKLPHKNGPRFRVGNPLGKDFLAACGEGGALASKRRDLAGALLRLSIQLAYWRSVRDRLGEQVRVRLPHDHLPAPLREHPEYNTEESYGAILPALVVSGEFFNYRRFIIKF